MNTEPAPPATLRVAHFGPAADEVGGMATVISTMADHCIGADEVTVHSTWSMHSQARTVRGWLGALATIARAPKDLIIHVHLSEGGSFVREGLLLLAARRCGLRTVATLHGADFAAFAARRRRLVGRVLRDATLITSLSTDHVGLAQSLAPGSTVAVVPNPVLIEPEEAPDTPPPPPTALFTGEIGLRKGADVLVAAWPRVRAAVPEARCILVGPSTELVIAAQDGLTVLAPVPQREIRALVRAARCVVLPSRAEALPMTLLEAMACARPFVSTPVGGIPSLAEGGRLVAVGDAEGLATALIALLEDAVTAGALGRAGREACARTRGIPVVDAQLRALYGALAGP